MKNQFLYIIFAFVIVLTAVGGAFGVVRTRIEVARLAKENASTEKELARLEREEMHLSSVIADLERPDRLKILLAEHQSTLAPVPADRWIRIGEGPDLPGFESVRVSDFTVETASFQLSSQQPVRRPVFIRE